MKCFIRILGVVIYIALNPSVAQDFVNLNDQQVGYYAGANLKYYGEYRPKQFEGYVSFPLHQCDPVSIDSIGTVKAFFTSAIEGHQPMPGQGIVIPTPESLTKIVAVRGKAESNGYRFEAYIGYNPDEFVIKGSSRNKVYTSVLLALQVKSTRNVENRTVHLLSGAQYLTNMIIGQEIKKLLQNPTDWNWNGALFQQYFQQMIPKREGFSISHQMIYLNTPYWTKDENKLKGTKYKGTDK